MQQSIARQIRAVARQPHPLRHHEPFPTAAYDRPVFLSDNKCQNTAQAEYDRVLNAAAQKHQLDPALLRAVIEQESGFQACAVSRRGAMGLMQLMPQTAAQFHVADPFDPAQNISAGAQYLKDLIDRFRGDWKLALAAYNAGPARVDANSLEVPPIPETEDYVRRILDAIRPELEAVPDR